MQDKNVWQQIKEFFESAIEMPKEQRSAQELIDLAEDYKVMMSMPSWKHYENEIKIMFMQANEELKDNSNLPMDRDYYKLKMAQERLRTLKDVMYISFIAIGQGHQKEKERKQKGDLDDGTSE